MATRTTVDTIDGAFDSVSSFGSNVSAWIDSTDYFVGSASVHWVDSFAGGVSKATGDSLPDPSDSGYTFQANASLWGTGPMADDVNQGAVGDCYFVATLAAFARSRPAALQESAVDQGDGTFAVQFFQNGAPVYVRVSNDLSYQFAHPGPNGTIWAPIMEKAFAFFRDGSNTYSSTAGGWMREVYLDLGVNWIDYSPGSLDEGTLYNLVSVALANGEPVTFATPNGAPDLVGEHSYTFISVDPGVVGAGSTTYLVRNPWGSSGDALEDNSGYAYLTFAQIQANFCDLCIGVG